MSKKSLGLDAMSIDEMWQLHEEISRILSVRLNSEKRQLEKRLAQLRRDQETRRLDSPTAQSLSEPPRERRKYPRVLPKYRNPEEHSETWSGRGKQPRWLVAALKEGHKIEEFAIRNDDEKKGQRQRRRV
jgi:DNA-binding protein H-NS